MMPDGMFNALKELLKGDVQVRIGGRLNPSTAKSMVSRGMVEIYKHTVLKKTITMAKITDRGREKARAEYLCICTPDFAAMNARSTTFIRSRTPDAALRNTGTK